MTSNITLHSWPSGVHICLLCVRILCPWGKPFPNHQISSCFTSPKQFSSLTLHKRLTPWTLLLIPLPLPSSVKTFCGYNYSFSLHYHCPGISFQIQALQCTTDSIINPRHFNKSLTSLVTGCYKSSTSMHWVLLHGERRYSENPVVNRVTSRQALESPITRQTTQKWMS